MTSGLLQRFEVFLRTKLNVTCDRAGSSEVIFFFLISRGPKCSWRTIKGTSVLVLWMSRYIQQGTKHDVWVLKWILERCPKGDVIMERGQGMSISGSKYLEF